MPNAVIRLILLLAIGFILVFWILAIIYLLVCRAIPNFNFRIEHTIRRMLRKEVIIFDYDSYIRHRNGNLMALIGVSCALALIVLTLIMSSIEN